MTALYDDGSSVELDLSEKEHAQADLPENPPVWNAYSGSGDVTGRVVYCNYGRKIDFERVKELVNGRQVVVYSV